MKKLCVSLLGLISVSAVNAAGLDVSLSNKTASINYLFNSSQVASGGADASVGVFYTEKNKIKATLVNGKILVTGNIQGADQYLKFGVGAKVAAGKTAKSDDSLGYLGLGTRLGYLIPSAGMPMGIYGEAFYAPSITSFGKTEEALEATVGFEAQVAPSAKGYIGFRLLDMDIKGGKHLDLDKNIHIGIVLEF